MFKPGQYTRDWSPSLRPCSQPAVSSVLQRCLLVPLRWPLGFLGPHPQCSFLPGNFQPSLVPVDLKHAKISKLVIYLMISLNVRWAGTKLEFWNCLILPVKGTGCVVYPRLERLSIDVCIQVHVTRAIP